MHKNQSQLLKNNWLPRTKNYFKTLKDLICKIKLTQHIGVDLEADVQSIEKTLNERVFDINTEALLKSKIRILSMKITEMAKGLNIMSNKQKKKLNKTWEKEHFKLIGYKPKEMVGYGTLEDRKEGTPSFRNIKLKNDHSYIQKTIFQLSTKPEVILSRLAYEKIRIWGNLLDSEIQSLGIVEQNKCYFYVKDFFLFHQIVSSTTCETKNSESGEAMIELIDRLDKLKYSSKDLKIWWHSHNKMGTNPSQRDLQTTTEYNARGYFISMISNHRGDFDCKLSVKEPFEMEFTNVPVLVEDNFIDDKFIEDRKEEINLYVKEHCYSRPTYNPSVGLGYYDRLPYHYNGIGIYGGYDDGIMGYQSKSKGTPINNPVNDQKAKEEILNQSDEYLYSDAEVMARIQKGEAPYEHNFTEATVQYCWDSNTKKYRMFDVHSNAELGSEDLKEMGAPDYNREITELEATYKTPEGA